MPLYMEKSSLGVSKLRGTSQRSKHKITNEGNMCLEPKGKPPVHVAERDKQQSPTSSRHPSSSESRHLQSLASPVHSSPTGFHADLHKSKNKLKPQIIGRVMSEIHSNLAHKEFASEDFLHVLVDRVIAEVANEINLYDEGAPLIYPALAQTNMLPQPSNEQSESLVSSHTYEEPSDSSFDTRKTSDKIEQKKEQSTGERQSNPSEITVSVVLSESSSDSSSECSEEECCPEIPHIYYQKFKAKTKRLCTSRTFWCTLLLLLFILLLFFISIIFGAILGLAICGPHSCSRTWQSSNTFHWHYLLKPQSQETLANLHGLF